jgi:uncharacterized protein YifE (UPF0438 family)
METIKFKDFVHKPEKLFGQITVNGKSKIGEFRPSWSKYTNQLEYSYYTPQGNKGTGGFTMKRAFVLFNAGKLSKNPEHGKPENYI